MRAVYDTNVLISGFFWHGDPFQCLLLARLGVVHLLCCNEILAEFSEKLRDPFGFSENHIQSALYHVKQSAELIQISGEYHTVQADPDDDKFIECALLGKAEAIVSSDHHLLNLQKHGSIFILSPAEFVRQFEK